MTDSLEKIQTRITELQYQMYGLQCSDDLLFTNANGNLPLYESWQQESRALHLRKAELQEKTSEQGFAV